MKNLKFLFSILLLLAFRLFSQENSPDFLLSLDGNKLLVIDNKGQAIFNKEFFNPFGEYVDFDNDGVDEYYVKDFFVKDSISFYNVYVYSLNDDFHLIDSIYSGMTEPMILFSDEANCYLLVCGQPELDSLNLLYNKNHIYPSLNCFKYEGEKFYNDNEELYDIFINENDVLISYIEKEYLKSSKTCSVTNYLKPVLAAVYLNLLKASETSMAKQFLSKFYFCEDKDEFSNFLIQLL